MFLNIGDSNLNPNLNLHSQDCKKYHITTLCMGIAGAGWYKKEVAHRLLTKVVLIVLNFIKVRKIQKPRAETR